MPDLHPCWMREDGKSPNKKPFDLVAEGRVSNDWHPVVDYFRTTPAISSASRFFPTGSQKEAQ